MTQTITRKLAVLTLLASFALTFLVYGLSLGNGFAFIDDGLLIFNNNILREISFENFKTIFTSYDPELYVPLTLVSYQFDYLIAGYAPWIYHLTNLILHSLNVFFVAGFVYLLTRKKWLTLFCSIFFAIHPLHTEAVAWASARKDLLSTMFFFASLSLYLLYNQNGKRANYWTSTGAFLIGLFAKVSIVTLPVILLILDYLRGRRDWRKLILEKIPYFALSIIFGIVALGGKENILVSTSTYEKIILGCKSAIFYISKLFFPINLSIFYPQLTDIQLLSIEFLIPFILVIGLCATAIWIHKKEPLISFGIIFYLITLAPSFFTVTKGGNIYFASDRYAYAASVGFFLVIGILLFRFCAKLRDHHNIQKCQSRMKIGSLCVAGIFTMITIHQSLMWGNGIELSRRSTMVYPDFYLPHVSLGANLRIAKQWDESIASYQRAIDLNPLPNFYGLIGQVHAEQGNYKEALDQFQTAIEKGPNDSELHYGMGQVHALMGNDYAAIESYERAIELMREGDTGYKQFARILSTRRDMAFFRLGLVYGKQGNHRKAIEYYEQSLELNPYHDEAHFNTGVGYGFLNDNDQAIFHYQEVIKINPYHVKARNNLGILLARDKQFSKAKGQFEEILKFDPTNQEARKSLLKLRGVK